MKDPDTITRCFYCDGNLAKDAIEHDHFPIPKECGGKETVPVCLVCHDMKDRFPVGTWPVEWLRPLTRDMETMSRESRIIIAKLLRMTFTAMHRAKQKGVAL